MRIFSDRHHSGLAASLNYLFEDRLNHEVYFPIGLDWHDKGYWKIATLYGDAQETINQYLACPPSTTPDNVYYINDPAHHLTQKYITLDKFIELKPDVVIASIPQHITPFKKLIKDSGIDAKLVYHIGNVGWHNIIPWKEVDNIMASVKPFPAPENKNVVFYKQEFPTELFENDTLPTHKRIASFVNCMPQPLKWLALKNELPEYEFQAHGIGGEDGVISGLENVAGLMRSCRFGYHNKPEGDGFGHVIHNWFATGRPIIVNMGDYRDKLAGDLLIDGETCIDMSDGDMHRVAGIVREISDLQYVSMVDRVRIKFKENVDFNDDASKVSEFLNRLI
jgi:hypothetical protein